MPLDSPPTVSLLSVATAVPPHRLLQADAAATARRLFSHRYAAFERLAPVFETSGIRQRYTVRPLDWYTASLDWPERNAAYLDGAQALFVDAATAALADAGCTAAEIDSIVTVSSTAPFRRSPRSTSAPRSTVSSVASRCPAATSTVSPAIPAVQR